MALYGKGNAGSRSSYSGEFPEGGAIFMSSRATKEECLRRKLFGLPMTSADFVKAISSGMTLFLFEFESRKLYGVFEAVSDGRLNIVPRAFQYSSHKPFPAQVRVRVIWDCFPLPEDVFCDAIIDNYYEKYKFNFGLSKQQVHRLLQLFDSQRMRPEKPLLNNKARKRQFRDSTDRRLVMTAGERGDHLFSGSKQVSMHEQGKHVGISPPYGDYIPLISPNQCGIEVNVKAVYSNTSEPGRIVIPCVNVHLLSPATQGREYNPGTSVGFPRKITDSDLVPNFVREKEKTYEADDVPVKKISQDVRRGHERIESGQTQTMSYERASVFSRLTYT